MSNSIISSLALYGFIVRTDGSYYYGIGSLMWGHTAVVRFLGKGRYEVATHVWFYNCEGDCVQDDTDTIVVFASEVISILAQRRCLGRIG